MRHRILRRALHLRAGPPRHVRRRPAPKGPRRPRHRRPRLRRHHPQRLPLLNPALTRLLTTVMCKISDLTEESIFSAKKIIHVARDCGGLACCII